MADLTTYEKINEEIKFTEEETVELLKLSEKEILVLILSELKKINIVGTSIEQAKMRFKPHPNYKEILNWK